MALKSIQSIQSRLKLRGLESLCSLSSLFVCAVTDTVVSGLCELLDEFFERTEAPGEDEGEEAGTFLSLPEIRSITEDVVKLRAKNLIQNVPIEYLVRLLSLLDRHVQRSHEREVDDSDDVSA